MKKHKNLIIISVIVLIVIIAIVIYYRKKKQAEQQTLTDGPIGLTNSNEPGTNLKTDASLTDINNKNSIPDLPTDTALGMVYPKNPIQKGTLLPGKTQPNRVPGK